MIPAFTGMAGKNLRSSGLIKYSRINFDPCVIERNIMTDKDTHEYETEFGVVSLTSRELLDMPKDHRDFLLAASFIANDIKFHWSMMVRSPIDAAGNDLRAMQCVRWFWCSRKLSSVIIEATNTLDGFCGKIPLVKK